MVLGAAHIHVAMEKLDEDVSDFLRAFLHASPSPARKQPHRGARKVIDLIIAMQNVEPSDLVQGRIVLSDQAAIGQAFLKIPDHIDCYFGIAGLSGLKTDYATTFNCDYTANWYITEQYLKTRMSAGGAIMYVSSTAGLNWMKYRKEEEKVISSSSWDAVQEAIAHLEKSSPSTFAYIFAKRCIS